MKTKNEGLFVKVESSYGVDAVPGAADAIRVSGLINANPAENANFAEREVLDGSFGSKAAIFGGALYGIQVAVELKGSGDAGGNVPPEFGPLLRACALNEAIGASDVVYTPVSTGLESATIYYYQDGLRYRVTGCRGNVSLEITAGKIPTLNFTMTGRLTTGDPADVAMPAGAFDAVAPVAFRANNMLSLDGSFYPSLTDFSLDLGNVISTQANVNSADGFDDIEITDRAVSGQLNPNMTLVATRDWVGNFKNSVASAIAFTHGSAAGNIVDLSIPIARNVEPGFADSDGNRKFTYGFQAEKNAGNDELSLTFS